MGDQPAEPVAGATLDAEGPPAVTLAVDAPFASTVDRVLGAAPGHPHGPRPAPAGRDGRPRRSHQRRHALAAVGTALAALVLALSVVSGLHARAETRRTERHLAATRADLATSVRALERARVALAEVRTEVATGRRALASVAAELSSVRAQLARQEANLYVEGVSAQALDTCMWGVQDALNLVALNNGAGARTALSKVSPSCRLAHAEAG